MKNQYLPLIVGVSLPLILILAISIVIFTPSLLVNPKHNFIYTTSSAYYPYNYEYRNTYKVENDRLVLEAVPPRENITQTKDLPTLYVYDVRSDSAHQITFEEAQDYSIDLGPSSPDGYTLIYQYGNNGIFELLGSGNDNRGYFISRSNGKRKLNGLAGDGWNSSNFKLIGWIK